MRILAALFVLGLILWLLRALVIIFLVVVGISLVVGFIGFIASHQKAG